MKMIPNYKKIEEDIKNGKIVRFKDLLEKDIEDGLFTREEDEKDLKEEIEENTLLTRKRYGRKVRAARLERFLTQEEFAKLLHTTKAYISEIENGKQNISTQYASKIAKALHMNFVWSFK